MSKALLNRYSFQIFLCTFSLLFATSETSVAQVTSDNTTNTQVDVTDNVSEITGGETRGDNLFHSFQDFSVTTGNEAFFNNADSIGNIFSRVTGGNISNIDGAIRANGSANLFLINPAGILFGQNASLNIGGSFYGSSASSIVFENGEFSTDLDNPPVLTVNAPIGLGFRDNPGDIASNQAGLEVPSGETLALLGGNLNFDGGKIEIFGGRVELGGLTESGEVNINNDGSFNFPDAVARGNVSFANTARVIVAGSGGGSININASNLSLTSGSQFLAGIFTESGSPDTQAGDVVIDLTEDLVLDNSQITNNILSGIGNAGNVIVDARNITFNNGGNISISNNGEGNIGDTIVTATGDITFDGSGDLSLSGITNGFLEEASGSIGEINLTAQNLDITNGADIGSLVSGNSDSGDINLNIADTISIDGSGVVTLEDGIQRESRSSISSGVSNGTGNSGNININTQNLFLSRRGLINSSNSGQGNAGDININTDSLSITQQGSIVSNIAGSGDGGNIIINAENDLSIESNPESEFISFIAADIRTNGTGNAGNIEINTPSLVLNRGSISTDVLGDGNGGTIKISAIDSIELSNQGFIQADVFEGSTGNAGNIEINTASLSADQGFISADVFGDGNGGTINISAIDSIELSNEGFITADVAQSSTGNAADLTIETAKLTLSGGSSISATTLGNANAGNVSIIADESISLSGIGELSRGGIFANALIGSGSGGDINLTTEQLTISDGATITASNFSSLGEENGGFAPGTGEPGNISITANSLSLEDDGRIDAETQAETGTGAGINLQIAESIFLSGDSFISAQARGNANGGNLNIDTQFIVAFEGNNDIIASAEQGQGGNINITAESLLGIAPGALNPFTNDINASSEFGLDGSVSINVPDVNSIQGASELSTNIVVPEETTAQACNANRGIAAKNGLTIKGKGGIPATPEMPLDSANTFVTAGVNETDTQSALPQPVKTSIGEIQLARGIKVTEKGGIILTAYRTNNQGDRLPNIETSCGFRKTQ